MPPTHPLTGTSLRGEDVSSPTPRTETRCIPLGDAAFVRAVDRVVDEMEALGQAEPRALEVRLRRDYPRVRILARPVLTGAGASGALRWYAFRDGAALPAPLDFE